jgi:hypothetical protein
VGDVTGLHVIATPDRPFVCPWCAGRFLVRQGLSEHWRENPECRRNRNVSNPLQTKYGAADTIPARPGEYTLFRVRSPTCDHEERKPIKDAAGAVIARQCMNCYATLPAEDPT